MRDQIKADIQHLDKIITTLQSGKVKVQSKDGKWLDGIELQTAIEKEVRPKKELINELNKILTARILPEKYISPITKQTYFRTPEEKYLSSNSLFYSFSKKQSKKTNKSTMSEFVIENFDHDKELHFKIENRGQKCYPAGGYARAIKKGYITSNDEPNFAVKVFKKNIFNGNTQHELRIAMRAAYCSRLLGRTGVAYRNNGKQYFVTDWYNGDTLINLKQYELQKLEIGKRIQLALDLVRQVAILHNNGLIHCDIKPQNVIISPTSIYLIDLDSVRLKNESTHSGIGPMYTSRYLDAQSNWDTTSSFYYSLSFDEKSDMYALGLTLAFLFPDLLDPTFGKSTVNVNGWFQKTFEYETVHLHYGKAYQQHKALGDLIATLSSDKNSRPKSLNTFFDDLKQLYLSKYGQKDENNLLTISENKMVLTGEKAISEIETEIGEYNQREHDWRISFSL